MNSLQAFLVIGLILVIFPMSIIPIANPISQSNDLVCTSGIWCFIAGNLGFVFMFFLIVVIFYWMSGGN